MESSHELEMYETIVTKINYTEINIPEDELGAGMCRICMQFDESCKLIVPCHCTGSIKYVHEECLKAWLLSKGQVGDNRCELCHSAFSMDYKLGYKCSFRGICIEKSDYMSIFPLFLVVTAMVIVIIIVLLHKSQEDISESKRKSIYMFTGGFSLLLLILIGVFTAILCRMCIKNTVKRWNIFSVQHESFVKLDEEFKEVLYDEEYCISPNVRFSGVMVNTPEVPINGLMTVKADGSFVFSPHKKHKNFIFRGPDEPQSARSSKIQYI